MQTLTDKNFDAFAKAVRAELSDLPKREIQELTEGLEADLAERFASAASACVAECAVGPQKVVHEQVL